MRSRPSATVFRRRLTYYVKALVLLWMVACQFPLPLAHSHQAMFGGTLDAHLRQHHACTIDTAADCSKQCAQTGDELHWHWMMPWDVVDEDGQPRLPQTLNLSISPMAGWMGNTMIDSDHGSRDLLPQSEALLSQIWIAAEPLGLPPEQLSPGRPPANRITYDGVSLCTRLCVSRC